MNKRRAILAVCAALGWWGAIYPQFTMVKGTYAVVREDETLQQEADPADCELDSRDIYWKIMGMKPGQIRFKSRLVEEIRGIWPKVFPGALQEAKENKNDSGKY